MTLDPGAQEVLELIQAMDRRPFHELTTEEARNAYARSRQALQPEPVPVAQVHDLWCPGPGGRIRMRLYRSVTRQRDRTQPALVYFHGGGWVLGDLDSHDGVCREIANRTAIAVVSVDYRLGPEHLFPAAVEDAIAATAWIEDHAPDLGIDDQRIAVGGDSAGGNLAAVVAINARDSGRPAIKAQVLAYPVVDMSLSQASHARLADVPPIPPATMRWFFDRYCRDENDKTDWRAAPLLAKSHANLPPALIIVGGYDPLCDEGEAYAQKLRSQGSEAEVYRMPGQIHGFLTMSKIITEADQAHEAMTRTLQRYLQVE
ncbi:MAG: alpha/beta hydrolase [Hyphomicrobiaceae bacterium]